MRARASASPGVFPACDCVRAGSQTQHRSTGTAVRPARQWPPSLSIALQELIEDPIGNAKRGLLEGDDCLHDVNQIPFRGDFENAESAGDKQSRLPGNRCRPPLVDEDRIGTEFVRQTDGVRLSGA